jgi:transcriptional regulator with XRE-family HTH domain
VETDTARRCVACGGSLSRFNAGARCGPCQRRSVDRVEAGFWTDPQVSAAVAAWDMGTVARLYRQHTGLSQSALARLVSMDQSEVSRLERGQKTIKDRRQLLLWVDVLGIPDGAVGALPTGDSPASVATTFTPLPSGLGQLLLPAGQNIAATVLPALTVPADSFRGNEVHLASEPQLDSWLRMPMRALIVGSRTADAATRQFALDAGWGLRARDPRRPGLAIPAAYELDDLTYGILWAAAGFDAALLGDDAALHDVLPLTDQPDLDPLADAVRERPLNPGSLMLLGSQTSARYILGHRVELAGEPFFWTREQRGEEAATWLFFRHKYRYLRRTTPRQRGASTGRAFCIPPSAIADSPAYERVLLFLAVALMESLGTRTWITTDPDYAQTDGFVLVPRQRALIANWVRTDGVSELALTTRPGALRTFGDAVGHAGKHSVNDAGRAADRLVATADYLGLDRRWLGRRCAQLATSGTAGLAKPRSRLLGVDGLDAACRFVATHFASPAGAREGR